MEELLITEPGPPKGAKPINGTASKSIAPPVGAKKKEPTVSEPDSNDGSTQAGSDVSQEPVPKGVQPLGKSGESDISFDPKESLIQKQDNAKIEPPSQLKNRSQVEELNKISTAFDEAGGMQPVASFNKAVVSGLAAIPKSVGILAKQLDDLTGAPSKPIEEYATYDLGKWIEDKALKLGITATDPTRNGFYDTQVPQAFGSVASIILTGMGGLEAQAGKELMVNAPKGILGQIGKAGQFVKNPATVSGGLQMAVPEYEQALKRGRIIEQFPNAETFAGWAKGDATGFAVNGNPQSTKFLTEAAKTMSREELKDWYNSFESADEEAFMVFLKNYGVGQTEALPLAKAFNRINKITGGDLVEILKAGGKGGLEEASQEAIQNYFTNQIAKGSYDPERDPMMGMIDASKAGFFVGFVLPGLGAALKGASPETQVKVKQFVNNKLQEKAVDNVPNANPPAPAQVVSEARTSIPSADNTQKVEEAAEKVIATTVEQSLKETTEARRGTAEAPIQQSTTDIITVGDNYVQRDGKWFVKDAEGIERPLISDNPNKTQEEQNTELAQLKELKAQLEAEAPVKVDLSPTGKSRIAEMEANTPEGRVRKWLFGGGQLLWNSKSQGEGKPALRGVKDETGYGNKERQAVRQYVHDTDGVSVEQAAEQLAAQYQDRSPQEYRNAIIEVFSSDPKKWYEQQVRDEDPDYVIQEEQWFEEAGQLDAQIKQLETQEEGVKETNQQLYENERRVNYGSSSTEDQAAGGQVGSPRTGGQAQVDPRESIRKNGDANKSKQALAELQTKNLTHVPGLGMGQNQAKGTYVSTEDQNRYETEENKPVKVRVNVQNPFVSEENAFYNIQREIIQSRFGKQKIEDLTETEQDLLAEMVTEHFMTEGYDSIYLPQSETQEGELIIFDRAKVTIMDDARIEYENAVHASTQTTLQLEFVPDTEFLKTDKPIELRERQKKIRKDLARLNQLIKCR